MDIGHTGMRGGMQLRWWRAMPRRRRLIVVGSLLETALLYVGTSALGAGLFLGPASNGVTSPGIRVVQKVVIVASFILPSAVGALARSLPAALGLALIPWWLDMLLHADSMLHATAAQGGFGLDYGAPPWLTSSSALTLLATFAIFSVLGLFGWLVRQAVTAS